MLLNSKLQLSWRYAPINDSVLFEGVSVPVPLFMNLDHLPKHKREFLRFSIQSILEKEKGCTLQSFLNRVFGKDFASVLTEYFSKVYSIFSSHLAADQAMKLVHQFDPAEALHFLSTGTGNQKVFVGREPESSDWDEAWSELRSAIPNHFIENNLAKIDLDQKVVLSTNTQYRFSHLIATVTGVPFKALLQRGKNTPLTDTTLFVFTLDQPVSSATQYIVDDACFYKVVSAKRSVTAFAMPNKCTSATDVEQQLRRFGLLGGKVQHSRQFHTSAITPGTKINKFTIDADFRKESVWWRPPDVVFDHSFADCQQGMEAIDAILRLPDAHEPTFYGHGRDADRFKHDTPWHRYTKTNSAPLEAIHPLHILVLHNCQQSLYSRWSHKNSPNRVVYVLDKSCKLSIDNLILFKDDVPFEEFLSRYESLFPLGSIVSIEANGSLVEMAHFNPKAVRLKFGEDLHLPRRMIVITPTYSRDERLERLCRLGNFLSKDLHTKWIVVEDGANRDPLVLKMLHQFDGILDWEYFHIGPSEGKGHVQRNFGLNYIRDTGLKGQVYFMDDDNRYDDDLFTILRELEPMRVGIIAVGNLHDGVERPIYDKKGEFVRFHAFWKRPFMVDMAGFTFDAQLLNKLEQPLWKNYLKGGESQFISRLIKSPSQLQPLGNFSTIVPVAHNKPIYWEHTSTCVDIYSARLKDTYSIF